MRGDLSVALLYADSLFFSIWDYVYYESKIDTNTIIDMLDISFFRGANPFLREDKAVFIREKHSIHIVDTNRNHSIAECQRNIPMTKDGKEYKELQKKMLNQFIENENNIILRDLCSEFSQDFVIFNIAYDNSGSFVSASLVFPNKDEMDSTIISDIFLNKVYDTVSKSVSELR